jgi:ABC-type Na+ efflux pump permease subunit
VSSRRPSLFGPLVWWELVLLARRGHAARARVVLLYSLLLAIILCIFWWTYPSSPMSLFRGTATLMPLGVAAELGQSLAFVLLQAQILLVAVITPAYAAATIAYEKDRQTLPLLLITDLTDREIVWGKTAGRLLFVLSVILTGTPVLFVTLFFGGVDLQFLAAGYALIGGTAILAAAIGISAACHSPDSRTALVRAYGLALILIGGLFIPPFVLASPFAMLSYTRMNYISEPLRVAFGFGYPIGQITLAFVLMVEATRGLRTPGATAGALERTEYPEPPRGRPVPVVLEPSQAPLRPLPPIDDSDPVLWKERHSGRTGFLPMLDTPVRWLGAIFTVIAVMLFATGAWELVKRALRALDPLEAARMLGQGSDPPDNGGNLMMAAGVFAAGLYLLPLAVGVTGAVAGERHRGTLDSLLTTLLTRRAILRSKARAHIEGGVIFAAGALTGVGCGFGVDGGVWLGLSAMVALAAAFALVVAVGAWLSVRCATPVRAFRLCLPAVVGAIGLPVLVHNEVVWDRVAPSVNVGFSVAALCMVAAIVFWWRAEVDLERGE